MEDNSPASKTSQELNQLLVDLSISDLDRDFASADSAAKSLIQFKPVEVSSDKIPDPLAVATPQASMQDKTVNDIIQDINLSDVDRLNQKFSEQTARNNQSTEPVSSQPQQPPMQQEKTKEISSQPVAPQFDKKAFDERMKGMEERLARDTAHLASPPDIFAQSTPSIVDKAEDTKQNSVIENKPANITKAQEKKLPDWATMPIKKKEDVVVKEVPTSKEDTKVTSIQSDAVKTTKTEPTEKPNNQVATPVARINTPPVPRVDQEAITKKPELNQGLKPFSESQVAETPKPESKVNKPKRPIDNPNIANQIQSVLRGVNELSPALDVFNFKAYVNQGIKEGASMRGIPEVTDMESLLKQLPLTSVPKQSTVEQSQPQQQATPEQPFIPFNFNLGSTLPNISERKSSTALASNNDRSLIGINQNLNKISISLQQTQQTLVNSLNSLNNTAMEILRTIPTISLQQGQSSNNFSGTNKSNFTPTESLNLIGNYRDKLGLTPRTFNSNTVFPGNKSIG